VKKGALPALPALHDCQGESRQNADLGGAFIGRRSNLEVLINCAGFCAAVEVAQAILIFSNLSACQ
jgi:hypothetical protein